MTSSAPLSNSLIADTPCRRCGYNLRGLTAESRCPECNSPVSVSIQSDSLRFCDPGWLEQIARGCSLYLWGILVGIIAAFISGMITSGLGVNSAIGLLIVLLGSLITYRGAWLVTTPDVTRKSERAVSARKLVRVAVIAIVFAAILEVILEGLNVPELFYNLFAVYSGLASLLWFLGQIALIYYLGGLAGRVPEPKQQNRAKILVWTTSICTLLLVLGIVTAAIGESIDPANNSPAATATTPDPDAATSSLADGLMMIGGCTLLPSGLILFLCFVSSLFLIYRLGRCFREQAFHARTNWERSDLSPPIARPVSQDEAPQQ